MQKGLRLGGSRIDTITGPSTYSILLPPLESNLPIQLLFGDVHRSFNNPCDDEKKNSYSIYEDKFLEILDEVAKVYPTHFYTESAYGKFIRIVEGVEDGYLFSRLVRKMKDCYANREHFEYERNCQTTYLKWEHVDSGYFENSMEGCFYQYIDKFLEKQIEYCNQDIPMILTDWLSSFEALYTFTSDHTVTCSALALTMIWMNIIIKYSETTPRKKDLIELSESGNFMVTNLFDWLERADSLEDRIMIRNEIGSIVERESGIEDHFYKFLAELMDVYFNSINIDNSSVSRQLRKYQATKGSNVAQLTKNLKLLPRSHYKDIRSALSNLFVKENRTNMLKVIQKLLQVPPRSKEEYYEEISLEAMLDVNRLKDCCESLKYFFNLISPFFLDIFFITRMLQGRQPCLSIGYFGDAHTQSVIKFLTEHLNYTVLAESPDISVLTNPDQMPRCIEMDDIDLDELLRGYLTEDRKRSAIIHIITLNEERQRRLRSLKKQGLLTRMVANDLKKGLPIPDFLH